MEGGAEGVVIHIDLLAVEHVVLVVDDNLDMAHLYRRYLTGTGFYMIHAAQGSMRSSLRRAARLRSLCST